MDFNTQKRRRLNVMREEERDERRQQKSGEFLLHSKNFSRGTNNRPIYELRLPIEDITHIKLQSAAVPISYYGVTSLNNSFTFEEETGGSTVVTIPVGNYSATEFFTALKAAMEAASVNTRTYTLVKNVLTGGMDITSSAGTLFVTPDTMSTITGFTVVSATAISVTSDSILDLSITNNLLIHGDFGQATDKSGVVLDNEVMNNVLASVPMDGNTGDVIYKDFQDAEYFKVEMKKTQTFELYWTDESGNIIDFNGGKWNVKIHYFYLEDRL